MSGAVDRATLWTRMRYLLETLGSGAGSEAFVDRSLDLLADLVGADLAVVYLRLESGSWRSVGARRRGRGTSLDGVGEPVAALLEEALREGRCMVRTLDDAPGAKKVVAAPLHRGAWHGARGPRSRGAIYLEMRPSGQEVDPSLVEFIDSAAVLVAVSLDQRARLDAVREDLRAHQALEIIDDGPSLDAILASESMAELRPDVDVCIVGESSVMILGESGTGKTQLAAAIAKASGRSPIVRATLGASDDLNTITSEIFGHERGAFSGAVMSRKGLVEYADSGTLILDEVLNLPPHAQQLLLDFTQFGTYRPLGYQGKEPKRADVRLITATNGNIRQAIADTRFRQDLYFRLAGVTFTLPPLRHRRHEIPDLATQLLRRIDPARSFRLGASARRLLLSEVWEWEGNIRQLQSVIRRARDRAIATEMTGGALEAVHIGLPAKQERGLRSAVPSAATVQNGADSNGAEDTENGRVEDRWAALQVQRSALEAIERELIDRALHENRGVVAHAARQLHVPRTSLLSRMSTLAVDGKKHRR